MNTEKVKNVKNEKKVRNIKDEDSHIYYNLTFINTENFLVAANASETRARKILDNPSEWLMSVIRFDVDSHTLPINIPLFQTGSTTATTSYITLKYLGNYYTQNVIFLNPSLHFSGQRPNGIFNYQSWLDFVNTALGLAFASTAVVGFSPLFVYNPLTQLIDLYVDGNFLPSAGANKIELFVNPDLYLYLTNFQYDYDTQPILSLFYTLRMAITNDNTVTIPAGSRDGYPISVQNPPLPAPPIIIYKCSQFAVGTASWNSVRGIILKSNLLPNRDEIIPTKPTVANNYSTSATLPIISDFLVPIQNDVTSNRVTLEYIPLSQYRYVDLLSTSPLDKIDFQMFWSDFLGNIYPIYLYPNTGMSVKILFEKKKNVNHYKN
jgi:hypothetical protein